MEKKEVKLTEWLLEGVLLFKDHFGFLILCSLVAAVISIATAGLLSGPMVFGLITIVLSLYDKKQTVPRVGDLFKGFRYLRSALVFSLLWIMLLVIDTVLINSFIVIGQVAAFFLFVIVMTFLMFGPFLIVDQNMKLGSALQQGKNMVMTNFTRFLFFGSLAAVAGQIGLLFCVIGILATIPIQICMVAVAYREVFCGVVTEYAVPAFTDESSEEARDEAARVLAEQPRVWEISEEEIEEFEAGEDQPRDPDDHE